MTNPASNLSRIVAVDPDRPDPDVLLEAARVLRNGGLVVIPTETVYGIAADALNPTAVVRLRYAKGRPDTKALPVMVAGAEGIPAMASSASETAMRLAARFWPGPLTLILSAGPAITEGIHSGTGKVGLRSPDHAVAQGVLAAAGRPLALTSANLSGEPPARTAMEAARTLGNSVDLYLDAGPCAIGEPSTVLDTTVQPPVILRGGALDARDLLEYIGQA